MSEQPQSSRPKRRAHIAWGPFAFTLILNVLVGWSLYHAFMTEIPAENQRVVDILLGNIMGAWFAANSYWFGTTLGSNSKTELLAKAEPIKERAP